MKQILLGVLLLFTISLFAQSDELIHFRVINSTDKQEISFAKIADRTENSQFLCDEKGDAFITISDSSIIKISAIGFHDYYYFHKADQMISSLTIPLIPKVYELEEYTMAPYPTVALFKHAFENLYIEDTSAMIANLFPFGMIKPIVVNDLNAQDAVSVSFTSPISGIYNMFSQRAKSTKKLKQLKRLDHYNLKVYKRYNPMIVERITGVTEPEILAELMEFCKPSDNYILAATDYEIAVFVLNCYERFLISGE